MKFMRILLKSQVEIVFIYLIYFVGRVSLFILCLCNFQIREA